MHQPNNDARALATIGSQPPVKLDPFAFEPEDFKSLERFATHIANCGLFPRLKNPSAAMLVVMAGRALELPVAVTLNNIWPIPQKDGGFALAMRNALGLSLAKRHPDCEWIRFETKASNHEVAIWRTKRKDDEEAIEYRFTIEDARRANLLHKNNWQHYPQDMLKWRALYRLLITEYPETQNGVMLQDAIEEPIQAIAEIVEPAAPTTLLEKARKAAGIANDTTEADGAEAHDEPEERRPEAALEAPAEPTEEPPPDETPSTPVGLSELRAIYKRLTEIFGSQKRVTEAWHSTLPAADKLEELCVQGQGKPLVSKAKTLAKKCEAGVRIWSLAADLRELVDVTWNEPTGFPERCTVAQLEGFEADLKRRVEEARR